MVARKKIALVRYTPRQNSWPMLAALFPQAEAIGQNGEQQSSPGFHMVLLPFKDDIRELKFPPFEGLASNREDVNRAQKIIESLSLGAFAYIENPVLQRHYAAVQALALGEDQPEQVGDLLQPDVETFAAQAPILKDWWSPIAPHGTVLGTKRPFVGDADAPRVKAARGAWKLPVLMDGSTEEMRTKVLSGEVEQFTVAALRDWLKARGLSTGGKKPELVERIKALVFATNTKVEH